jgi:hypothetical protein
MCFRAAEASPLPIKNEKLCSDVIGDKKETLIDVALVVVKQVKCLAANTFSHVELINAYENRRRRCTCPRAEQRNKGASGVRYGFSVQAKERGQNFCSRGLRQISHAMLI